MREIQTVNRRLISHGRSTHSQPAMHVVVDVAQHTRIGTTDRIYTNYRTAYIRTISPIATHTCVCGDFERFINDSRATNARKATASWRAPPTVGTTMIRDTMHRTMTTVCKCTTFITFGNRHFGIWMYSFARVCAKCAFHMQCTLFDFTVEMLKVTQITHTGIPKKKVTCRDHR